MDSEGGGKFKPKRHVDHGKPYTRRKTLMTRVTETFKDMLAPSWLVDLVVNVKKKTPPNSPSQQLCEETQVNSQHGIHSNNLQQRPTDTAIPSSSTFTPPTSFPLSMPPGSVIQNSETYVGPQVHGKCSTPDIGSDREIPPGPNSEQQFRPEHLPFNIYHQQNKSSSMIVNGDDCSELSDYSVSTSGCSSMVAHMDRKDIQQDSLRKESRIHQMRQEYGGSITPSKELEARTVKATESNKRKAVENSFLWSNEHSAPRRQPQAPAWNQNPSFNVSIFGSPFKGADHSSSFNTSQESSFYPGKTTYGGAASVRRKSMAANNPYQSPAKRQMTAKPINNSVGAVTSSTARKILDTLERMSSPLNDAKKIPVYNSSFSESPLSFTPSSLRRRSLPQKNISSLKGNMGGPPVYALQTPVTIKIAKQHPATQTSEARQSTSQVFTPVPAQQSHPGKMKRERSTAASRYKRQEDEDEEPEAPPLSTGIKLQVSNMPQFDFNATTSRSITSGHAGTAGFTFSEPIQQSESVDRLADLPSNAQKFQFSSPIDIKEQKRHSQGVVTTGLLSTPASSGLHFRPNTLNAVKKSSPEPLIVVSRSVKAPSELKSGSCMDVLSGKQMESQLKSSGSCMDVLGKGSPTKSVNLNGGFGLGTTAVGQTSLSSMFKKTDGSWECSTCMVSNKSDVAVCVACQTPKPGPSKQQIASKDVSSVPVNQSSLKSMFQKSAGSWDCSVCMINNKPNTSVCVACETPKPEAKPNVNVTPSLLDKPNLASLFKKKEGCWDCDTCMVGNNAEATKCAVCDMPKPGMKRTSSFTNPGGFSVGPEGGFQMKSSDDDMTSRSSANFGIGNSKITVSKAAEPSPLTGGFKFGDKAANPKSSDTDTALTSAGFKFGSSGSNNTDSGSSLSGAKFGGDATSKKQDSVNSVDSKPPSGGFKFGKLPISGAEKSTDSKKLSSESVTGGFSMPKSDTTSKAPAPTLADGFQFGKTDSSSGMGVGGFKPDAVNKGIVNGSGASSSQAAPAAGTNLFAFGATSAASTQLDSKPLGTATGGFNFKSDAGSSISTTSPASLTTSVSTAVGAAQSTDGSAISFGGGSQSSLNATAKPAAVVSFAFGTQPAKTEPNPLALPQPGGFSFPTEKITATATGTTATGIFGFGSGASNAGVAPTTATLFTSAPPVTSLASKPLGVDTVTGFGGFDSKPVATAPTSTTPSNAFQFKADPSSSTAQTAPIFGAPAAASTASSANMFQFGSGSQTLTDNGPLGKRSAPTESEVSSKKGKDDEMQVTDAKNTKVVAFTSPVTGGPFQHGPGLVLSTEATSGIFKFGQSTSVTFGKGPPNTTFSSFGSSTSTSTSSVPSFGTAAPAPTVFSSNTSTSSAFAAPPKGPVFGAAPTATTAAMSVFGVTTAPAFGTAAAAAPAFGAGTQNNTSAVFGNPPAAANPFGSNPAQSSAPSFSVAPNMNFGPTAQAPPPAQPQATQGIFQFGQPVPSQQPAVTTGTGFNFNAQPTANFNFSATPTQSSQPAAATPNAFQFNAGQPVNSNPFSVSSPASTGARRPIKKAVRKLRK